MTTRRWAASSGRGTAARVITGTYHADARSIRADVERALRSLRRELNIHLLIRRSLHRFRQDDYSRLVDSISGSVIQSLGRVSRDEAARVLWHVCRKRPQLLLTGLRGLPTRTPLASREPE